MFKVSRIPPIYERSTASNISIEQGGDFIVLSPWNRQSRLSSASRGVKSRPPEEEIRTSSKTEMIPLLSPTTEAELLKESWITPKMKPSGIVDGESRSQNFSQSIWEENFQDLSVWCMDQFPEQYDFPIGEAINPKLSDIRYENEVSTLEEVPKGFTVVYDEKTNCDENILNIADHSDQQPVVKYEQLDTSCILANESDIWLSSATDKNITPNTSTAISNLAPNAFSRNKPGNLKLIMPSHQATQLTSAEPSDPLEITTTSSSISREPESFDLLSYLYDDEVPAPSTSTSTSRTRIIETQIKKETETTVEIRNPEPELRERNKKSIKKLREPEKISFSSSNSSSSTYLEESIKLSERIERSRIKSAKLVKNYYSNKKRGVKRILESDSDQELSDGSYRESRIKNNEASKKSRMNKKAKETEMSKRAVQLEKDNKILRMKVEELEKLVESMRMALLQSALKKER